MTVSLFVHRLLCLAGIAVVLGVGSWGCSNSDQSSPSQKYKKPVDTSPVIAKVGTLSITANEFRSRFQARANKKTTADVFLKELMQEKLLLQAALKKKLHKSKVVRKAGEKMAVRFTLKKGFEGWFSPSMIRSSLLQAAYKENPWEFNRPLMVQTVHLLARFPVKRPLKDLALIKKEKALRPALEAKAKELSEKLLKAIQEKNIKTWQQFESFGREHMKLLNKPDERLQKWYTEFRKYLIANYKTPKKLWPGLKVRKHKLNTLTFCFYCAAIVGDVDKFINGYENLKTKVTFKGVKRLLTRINFRANAPVETVRYERLPGFPEKPTPPFPAMVDEFTKATYAMKNNTYSQKPVRTSFGYHIIFRIKTLPKHYVPYAKAEPKLRRDMYKHMKRKQFMRWTRILFHKNKIQVNLDRLRRMSKVK